MIEAPMSLTHEHYCPVCDREWEHDARSVLSCPPGERWVRCWNCWLEALHPKLKGEAMKQISKEEWDTIHDRHNKIPAIQAFRRVMGVDLRMAKNGVEKIWAGVIKLEDLCEKTEKCVHCDGTGFTK